MHKQRVSCMGGFPADPGKVGGRKGWSALTRGQRLVHSWNLSKLLPHTGGTSLAGRMSMPSICAHISRLPHGDRHPGTNMRRYKVAQALAQVCVKYV